MKNRFLIRLFSIVLTLILMISLIFNYYSVSAVDSRFDTNKIENEEVGDYGDTIRKRTGIVVTVAKYIAVSVAVIMLIVIGMRYMISAPADRADIKKHAVPYVIGAAILFGTSTILQIIQSITEAITTETT